MFMFCHRRLPPCRKSSVTLFSLCYQKPERPLCWNKVWAKGARARVLRSIAFQGLGYRLDTRCSFPGRSSYLFHRNQTHCGAHEDSCRTGVTGVPMVTKRTERKADKRFDLCSTEVNNGLSCTSDIPYFSMARRLIKDRDNFCKRFAVNILFSLGYNKVWMNSVW